MEVREGYISTEIGTIPNDWSCVKVGEITHVFSGGTPSTFIQSYWNGDIRWMNSGELNFKIIKDVKNRISQEGLYNSSTRLIPIGCVLIGLAGQGKTRGTAALNLIELCTNQSIASILPSPNHNSKYLYYYIDSQYLELRKLSTGDGGRGGLNLHLIKNFQIPLPPLPEQQAIAEVLSDTDNLIQALEKQIAKKRLIKQGAMQKLLTPKDGWDVKKFGDIFNICGGYSATREQLSNDGYCYLHYGDIHGSTKTYIDCSTDFYSIPKLKIGLNKISKKSLLINGDVVFVDASEDDEGTSRHIVIRNENNIPFISGLHTIVARSKDESLNIKYKSFCFQCKYIKDQFKFYAVGTKVSGISKTSIKNINIYIPPISEQINIANTLEAMDIGIERLKNKLSKYKSLKQGLMQNLLTGKIRLIQP